MSTSKKQTVWRNTSAERYRLTCLSTFRAKLPCWQDLIPPKSRVTASAFIPLICEQVRQSIAANLLQGETVPSIASAATSAVGSIAEGVAGIFFKGREGGARQADDPRAI